LERTLDDSANRRTVLPEAFLIADELVRVTLRILKGLQVNPVALQRNLEIYAPFAATEGLLMALSKAGADRQVMHERLREHSMAAWKAVQSGDENLLVERLCSDPEFKDYLNESEIRSLFDANIHWAMPSRAGRSDDQEMDERRNFQSFCVLTRRCARGPGCALVLPDQTDITARPRVTPTFPCFGCHGHGDRGPPGTALMRGRHRHHSPQSATSGAGYRSR
jgi:hypothetical protein